MKSLVRILAVLVPLLLLEGALAQTAPVRILVGFPPGGGTDVVARMVAEKMRESLAAPVVIDNRPGAGGQVAARALKGAPPDGQTLLASAPAPITLSAWQKLDYDPLTDFAPLSLVATFQLALVLSPQVPATTANQYFDWLKGDASRQAYGTTAPGATPHLLGTLIARKLGLDLVHVAHAGGAPLVSALAGGHVPAAVMLFAESLPLHKAGKIRIVASTGTSRPLLDPSVPTFVEQGYPELVAEGWMAFFAPAKTPPATIARLSAAIAEAVKSPQVRQRLIDAGYEPVGSAPEMLARRMVDDMEKWAPIARSLGFGDKQ